MLFEGFRSFDCDHAGVRLHGRIGGQGRPLLLLHGHPQTHAMWHLVAPRLARLFTVVLMDLRGYGDSSRLPSDAEHANYSKRAMAQDALAVMRHHGFDRFQVLAHDRGARVAHRLAADWPDAVERLLLLDIAPTLAMYEGTTEAFARAYWHWFFLIQPAPLPEMLIAPDPVRYLHHVTGRRANGPQTFAPEAMAEYERCICIAGSAQAMCEDYRAAATIDLAHDRADVAAGRLLTQPVHVLWGTQGVVGRCFDVLALWRARAQQATGAALRCGHYVAEEVPDALVAEAQRFFVA